ncbi:MAG: NHL repeat protein, partial [bacterium]
NGVKVKASQITEISKRAFKVVVTTKMLASPTTLNLTVTTKGGTTAAMPLIVEPSASVSTLVGSFPGFSDGTGKNALLANPSQVAFAPNGMMFIADQANNAIRRFDPNTSQLTTIAGDPNGAPGYVDTDEINNKNPTVRFSNPIGIVIDSDGTMYVTDLGNECIRRLRPTAQGTFTVDTLAGKSRMAKNEDGTRERVGEIGFLDDTPSRAVFSGPYGIVIDLDRNLLVTDAFNNVIRKITMVNGEATFVSTVIGNGFPGLSDGNGTSVQFNRPLGLLLRNNALIVSDFGNNSIRQVNMDSIQVQVVVGVRRRTQSSALTQTNANSPTFGDGNRFFAVLSGPISSTFDSLGNIYVLDFNGNRIRRVSPDGVVTTIVGGTRGFVDGSSAKVAFKDPRYMLMLDDKTIIIVDSGNNRIRRVGLP